MDISGGYDIQWDEDPFVRRCRRPAPERGQRRLILPFIQRCSDDRAAPEDLQVSFTNTDSSVVAVI